VLKEKGAGYILVQNFARLRVIHQVKFLFISQLRKVFQRGTNAMACVLKDFTDFKVICNSSVNKVTGYDIRILFSSRLMTIPALLHLKML
jgi:hypothetical protein